MRARVVKIDPLKESRNKGESYYRIYFQVKVIEDNKFTTKWAKTDVVPKFRNFKVWSPLMKVGNVLEGAKLKDPQTIDADSKVYIDAHVPLTDETMERMREPIEQLKLM